MALELYFCLFGIILKICHFGLPDEYLRFLLGALKQIFMGLLCMLEVKFDDDFLGVMRADECLQVHESIPHILVF